MSDKTTVEQPSKERLNEWVSLRHIELKLECYKLALQTESVHISGDKSAPCLSFGGILDQAKELLAWATE